MKNTFFYDFVKKTKPQQVIVRVFKIIFVEIRISKLLSIQIRHR